MSQWHDFAIETEGTGISAPLSEEINLLGAMLGHVIRTHAGQGVFDLQIEGKAGETLPLLSAELEALL